MSKVTAEFVETFHHFDDIDLETAKQLEKQHGINLWTHSAEDPNNEWKCSVEPDETVTWYAVTTATHAIQIATNDHDILVSHETLVLPRYIPQQMVTKVFTEHDFSKFAPYAGYTLELMIFGGSTAVWKCTVPDTEVTLMLEVEYNGNFEDLEIDLKVFGATFEVDHLQSIANEMIISGSVGELISAIQKIDPDHKPSGYRTFTHFGSKYIIVDGEDGDFTIYKPKLLWGIKEVDIDFYDELYHVYEELVSRPLIPFPKA